jgi:hypothetical protein
MYDEYGMDMGIPRVILLPVSLSYEDATFPLFGYHGTGCGDHYVLPMADVRVTDDNNDSLFHRCCSYASKILSISRVLAMWWLLRSKWGDLTCCSIMELFFYKLITVYVWVILSYWWMDFSIYILLSQGFRGRPSLMHSTCLQDEIELIRGI